MCPNEIYLGLKVVPKQACWGRGVYYVGTWTRRDCFSEPTIFARSQVVKVCMASAAGPKRLSPKFHNEC